MNTAARERGWYLVDYRRQVLSSQRLDTFPYPFMFASTDFSLGITEGIWDETIQPERFLHRNSTRFRRDTPITDDSTSDRCADIAHWQNDGIHVPR